MTHGGLALLLTGALAVGGAQSAPPLIDRELLHAAWARDGERFDFVIGETAILYEFDMREHPYELDGHILVIDFEDPTLGVQRKEILRLTADELELRDVGQDDSTVYRRVR